MRRTVIKHRLREILFQAERKQVRRHEAMQVCGMCEGLFMKLKINALLNEILISFISSLIPFYSNYVHFKT